LVDGLQFSVSSSSDESENLLDVIGYQLEALFELIVSQQF